MFSLQRLKPAHPSRMAGWQPMGNLVPVELDQCWRQQGQVRPSPSKSLFERDVEGVRPLCPEVQNFLAGRAKPVIIVILDSAIATLHGMFSQRLKLASLSGASR